MALPLGSVTVPLTDATATVCARAAGAHRYQRIHTDKTVSVDLDIRVPPSKGPFFAGQSAP
jgi:hypothetical protein